MASSMSHRSVCVNVLLLLLPSLPSIRLSQTMEEGTEEMGDATAGRREDGGGCHGNWDSVAARHHLLLCCAEWSTLIFKLHGHRQTKLKK